MPRQVEEGEESCRELMLPTPAYCCCGGGTTLGRGGGTERNVSDERWRGRQAGDRYVSLYVPVLIELLVGPPLLDVLPRLFFRPPQYVPGEATGGGGLDVPQAMSTTQKKMGIGVMFINMYRVNEGSGNTTLQMR